MLTLVRGQKIKLADLTPSMCMTVGLALHEPTGITWDTSCFGLDAQNKLSDDRYFIFYNQKSSPCGSVKSSGAENGDHEQFQLDLSHLPSSIRKLVFVVTIDGEGAMSQIDQGYLRLLDPSIEVGRFPFSGSDFGNERAIIVGELYFKDVWRFAAVGQGFDGGLEALLHYFGGEEETASPQPVPPTEVPQHLPIPPKIEPSSNKESTKFTCQRCGKELNLLSRLGIGYNKQTGRCRKCDGEIAIALKRFRNGFRHYCKDGVLSDDEWASLQRRAQKEGLEWAEALAFVRGDAIHFLEQTLANAASDGLISETEGANIHQLRRALKIPARQAQPILDRLTYLENITSIRKGILPTIQTGVKIESDEICHLECEATYHKVGATSTTLIPGRLVATNRQLHFLSPTGGTQIAWKSIMRIDCQGTGIYLELSKKTGNGYYAVQDPLYTEAVLDTLVRLAKRQLLMPQSNDATRHIPQDVKQAVWQRDQGKCAQCGATSYLEFDHIIPHSKGGANTVGNIQLLCRRCNLQKGDRL